MDEREFFVYIMTNKPYGVLYTGMTNDIARRVFEHKNDPKGFVRRYGLNRLVYCEKLDNAANAIYAEKKIKRWHRQWKIELIEAQNPNWEDIRT